MQDGLQSLVAPLCRAEWTRLSLSAELAETIDRAAFAALWVDSGGSRPWSFLDSRTGDTGPETVRGRFLLAGDGRFRHEFREDGEDLVSVGTARDQGPTAWPAPELLCPAWLPCRFDLAITGSDTVGGRAVTRVTGVPRPFTRGRRGITQISTVTRWRRPVFAGADEVLDQIDALVDAELGILLRCERRYGGRTLALSELTGLTLDPPQAADGKPFERPGDDDDVDGAVDEDDDASSGFATAVLHAADGLAAALAMTIRHAPQKSRGEPQWQAATAGEDWLPPEPADDGEPAEPVDGQLLALL